MGQELHVTNFKPGHQMHEVFSVTEVNANLVQAMVK